MVDLPVPTTAAEFFRQFSMSDFSAIGNKTVWIAGVKIAVVGSLETVLSLDALDRLDPYKRISISTRLITSRHNDKWETEVRWRVLLVGAAGSQTTTDKPPSFKNSVRSSQQVACRPCFRNVSECP
jgi:hypothetical protein